MKSKLYSVFGLLLAGTAALAANKEVGNGGGAWVCREQSGTIRWAKFVDLFEAQNEFHYEIEEGYFSPQEEALFRFAKLKKYVPKYAGAYYEALKKVNSKINLVRDVDLKVINDSLYRLQPSRFSCAGGRVGYEQLANYTDDDRILVNQDIYERLTSIEQAALLTHEAVYLIEREFGGAKDSVISRKIVAALYSKAPISPTDQVREHLFPERLEYVDHNFANFECGLKQTSIEDRIRSCANIPGSTLKSQWWGEEKWLLVARKGGYEVWKDTQSGQIWFNGDRTDQNEAPAVCMKAAQLFGFKKMNFHLPTREELSVAAVSGIRYLGQSERLSLWMRSDDQYRPGLIPVLITDSVILSWEETRNSVLCVSN